MMVHTEHAKQRHDNNACRVVVENLLGLTYPSLLAISEELAPFSQT